MIKWLRAPAPTRLLTATIYHSSGGLSQWNCTHAVHLHACWQNVRIL